MPTPEASGTTMVRKRWVSLCLPHHRLSCTPYRSGSSYIKRPNFTFSWTYPCAYDVANAAATVKDGLCTIAVKKKPDSGEAKTIEVTDGTN